MSATIGEVTRKEVGGLNSCLISHVCTKYRRSVCTPCRICVAYKISQIANLIKWLSGNCVGRRFTTCSVFNSFVGVLVGATAIVS